MENDSIQLEHQTAPESTRGLFDPPENKPFASSGFDKRRSFNTFSPLGDSTAMMMGSRPASTGFVRGHQRSRSAVMLSNNHSRRASGLQTLTEEGADDKRVTVDSLQDMINTLKSLPPVTIKEQLPSTEQQQQQPEPQRRPITGADTMQSIVQNTVQELRNIDKHTRRRSRRASSMTGALESSIFLRDAALTEVEAKLSGPFAKIDEDAIMKDDEPMPLIPRRHSASRSSIEDPIIRPGRRYSESSSGFDLNSLNGTSGGPKRMSLQQLPTLAENPEMGPKAGRRLSFNKPLTLEESNKKVGGHSRRSSRNLDYDWRSSQGPILAPNSLLQSFNLVPFTPTRVSFAKDDANPHQRRPLFTAHFPFSALPPLFRSRQLVRGTLRVNKRNRSDAYVSCEELDADIYICGSRDRNRALEGDVVAVKLVDVEKVLRDKKEKEEAKVSRNGGRTRTRMPDEEDENEIIFGGDEDVEVVKPKYCGIVVAVLERAQNQVFSGLLTLMRPNNKRAQEEKAAEEARMAEGEPARKEAPRIVWFKAADKRVPLIAIPIEQVPGDFVENNESYTSRIFVGSIKRWPITSLHPFGYLERELGQVSDLDVQVMAILADNNVTDSEFNEAVLGCLPPDSSLGLPDTSDRRDFTNVPMFTIDPEDSDVLDDALSIRKTGDSTFEVGVHVTDLSYYIQPHSALDKEARARAVRVDLVNTFVPMLPTTLTEKITNLDPDATRLGISVVWTMNSSGQIFDTWIGKSVIRSKAKFTYEAAQAILEMTTTDDAMERDIQTLLTIGSHLRERRLHQNSVMTLMRDELCFAFDQNQVAPVAVSKKTKLASQLAVKEFLFKANTVAAQKISSHFPEHALLRRHAPPHDRKIQELKLYASTHLGVDLDSSSAGALECSVKSISDPSLRNLMSVLILKTFQPPKYFCSGTHDIRKYSHYALSVPLFTHFTAPSRRYADIIIHRQLCAVFADEKEFYLDCDTIQKLSQYCNVKKEAAQAARDQSSLLFLSHFMYAKQPQPVTPQSSSIVLFRDATVVAVQENHFDVIIPEYNIEKRVHLAHLPTNHHTYVHGELTIHWKQGVATPAGSCNTHVQYDFDYEEDEVVVDEDALAEEMKEGAADPVVHGMPPKQTFQHHHPSVISYRRGPITTRRASVLRAHLSDSTAYSVEQASQTLRALDRIKVAVIVEMSKAPPTVRVLAANPFV